MSILVIKEPDRKAVVFFADGTRLIYHRIGGVDGIISLQFQSHPRHPRVLCWQDKELSLPPVDYSRGHLPVDTYGNFFLRLIRRARFHSV